ncbi:MAG: hypothetical protein V3W14_04940 [Candidatus Neomarinimicrobiota bacterium]
MEQHEFEKEFQVDQGETGSIPDTEEAGRATVVKSTDVNDFVPWKEDPLTSGKVAINRQTVIKKPLIRPGTPINIVPKVPVLDETEQMKVAPLMESDAIVGLKVVCSCGRSHEVRFEFDE